MYLSQCLAQSKRSAHMTLLPYYLGLAMASLSQLLYEAEFQQDSDPLVIGSNTHLDTAVKGIKVSSQLTLRYIDYLSGPDSISGVLKKKSPTPHNL